MKSFAGGNPEFNDQKNLLLGMEPRRVRDTFGQESIVWVEPGALESEYQNKLPPEDLEQAGFNHEIFTKACSWAIEVKRLEFDSAHEDEPADVTTRDVLHSYAAMDYILNGGLEGIDLHALLTQFKLPEVELSNKKIKHYSLQPMRTNRVQKTEGFEATWNSHNRNSDAKKYNIYLDTPVGIALMYKGKPNAVVGIAPMGQEELRIFQIQVVKPKKNEPLPEDPTKKVAVGKIAGRGLARIDWRGLLIATTCELARGLNIPAVGIQPAKDNKWVMQGKLSLKTAENTYDATAQRMGFSQNKSGHLYKLV
jgi:hypothetical protein